MWAVAPLARGQRAARWERRHGVRLWEGRVEQERQPDGADADRRVFVCTTPGRRVAGSPGSAAG
ncbi:hypothetical protein ACIHCQ_31355 [Streptomyces sp. NPDC052236]|uniref:hypothetical protein n=1 Tax=Streptomyces sp. NPDC052236 TaxID=3365686 RepID=UPI0037D8906A